MRYCEKAADCRMGYACFYSGSDFCQPDTNLDCDPTAAPDGRCDSAPSPNPGGCLRVAYGSGLKGSCYDGCQVGVGTCGSDQQCVVYDQRGFTDQDGKPWGDTFIGPVCIGLTTQNAVGTQCRNMSNQLSLDDCVEGAECYRKGAFPGADDLCKQLCRNAPDGDGGTTLCPSGTICTDIWKLFGTSYPAGLCL
jgi:hypothetical protein